MIIATDKLGQQAIWSTNALYSQINGSAPQITNSSLLISKL